MNWAIKFWQSTVGKKVIMAISGAVGFGFAFVHMAGNMLVYAGPDALNQYGAVLKGNAILLWGTRIALLSAVAVHILAALSLQNIKSEARPVAYGRPGNIQAKPGSRSMIWTGIVLALFLAYHIAHLTLGVAIPAGFSHTDVYANVIAGFSNPVVSGFYIAAMVLLALHLSHGGYSLFYSLGLIHPKYQTLIRKGSYGLCIAIVVGNISIPVAVLTKFLK